MMWYVSIFFTATNLILELAKYQELGHLFLFFYSCNQDKLKSFPVPAFLVLRERKIFTWIQAEPK